MTFHQSDYEIPANLTPVNAQTRSREPSQRTLARKGIDFANVVRCLGLGNGNILMAQQIAEQHFAGTPAIASVLKGAVPAGSVNSGTWGHQLVGAETAVYGDFVDYLRPQTIIGKFGAKGIPALTKLAFRVPVISQTAGGAGFWVGEGKPTPLTALAFNRTTLDPLKLATISVATVELLRDSSPAADALIRNSLTNALKEAEDRAFIDPANAGIPDVSPASILHDVTPIPATGTDAGGVREDIKKLFLAFLAAHNPPTSGVWIMPTSIGLSLGLMRNELGQLEFPGISMFGGTLEGLPVICSDYVPMTSDGAYVALVNASDIYLGDDGGIEIDISKEASLQMLDNPTNDSVTPVATQMVSMFQTSSVAFKAMRTINWSRRRPSAVQYLSGVTWGQAA